MYEKLSQRELDCILEFITARENEDFICAEASQVSWLTFLGVSWESAKRDYHEIIQQLAGENLEKLFS